MAQQPDRTGRADSGQGITSDAVASAQGALKEAALQVDTVVRNAANTATFGLADKADAAIDATLGVGGGGDWAHRYQAELDREAARTVYDSIHRGVARRLGETLGIGLDMAGGAEGGVAWSEGLPNLAKGKLGEALSAGKTILKGDFPVQFQAIKRLTRGYTRTDHATAKGLWVEAKFGPKARLLPRQNQAQVELGPQYRVDWWLPKHVGYLGGGTAGLGGLLSAGQNEPKRDAQGFGVAEPGRN